MQKKLLSLLLVLCMLLSMFPMALPVSAAEETATEPAEVTEIADAEAFLAVMTDPTAWSGNYKLTDNIDLTDLPQTPIGNIETAFTGYFDGNNKTISGINIEGTVAGTGLFGFVSSDGDTTVIKNLTLEGSVTGVRFTGGLIGIICGAAEIDGIVISDKLTVTGGGDGRIGGIAGGIVNNNAAALTGTLPPASDFDIVIKNCVNNSNITASDTIGRVGGIVGSVSPAVSSTGYYNNVTISNCVNNGDISGKDAVAGIVGNYEAGRVGNTNTITACSNYGDITSLSTSTVAKTGGIVGQGNAQTTGADLTVEKCYNEGTVSASGKDKNGNTQIGGIMGYAYLGKADVTISQCWNAGAVVAGYNDAAGILGLSNTATVIDCWNTGAISSTNNGKYIGGIIGRLNSTNHFARNYNAGTTTSTGAGTFGVGGANAAYASYYSDNYYSNGTQGDYNATYVAAADLANAASFGNLNAEGAWIFTDLGPELAYFHEHDLDAKYVAVEGGHAYACYCNDPTTVSTNVEEHSMVDGVCVICGAADCTHETTEEIVTLVPTCLNTGYKNVVCTSCGTAVESNVVVETDPDNHESKEIYIAYDEDNGCITYNYACCDAVFYEDWTVGADIYVSSTGITVTADTVIEEDIGLSVATAFADFEYAMTYAAASVAVNGEVTIHIVDKAEITTGNYKTPEYEGMITITGGELWFMTAGRRWHANGDVTFENMTFRTNANNGLKIFAQNHKMVFGEGVKMGNEGDALATGAAYPSVNNVKMYLFGGFENPTKGMTMDTDLTVRSGDFWGIFLWNDANDAVKDHGTGKLTIGKTNADDYLFTNYIVGYSTDKQNLSEASKVTIIMDGDVDVRLFYPGTQNDLSASSNVLYETDLVLKGNLNTVAREGMGAVEIMGTLTTTNTKINMYVDERVATAVADQYRFYGTDPDGNVEVDTSIENMATVVTVDTYKTYCNTYLTHTGLDADGICDECGYNTACSHDNTEIHVITPSTCSVAGVGNVVCTDCSAIVEENVELDLDAANHDFTGAYWVYDAEAETNVLNCPGCSTAYATSDAPVVYVDANVILNTGRGANTQSGITLEEAVLTLEEAFTRLSKTGGTVIISDRYEIHGDITLPANEKLVTITSLLGASDKLQTGLTNKQHGSVINFYGPVKIEKIILNGSATVKNISDQGYYNTFVFAAHWNSIEFGERLSTYGNAYVIAGGSYDNSDEYDRSLNTAVEDRETEINMVFDKTVAQKILDADQNQLQAAVTFFDRVYVGDRVRGFGPDSELTSYTVSNKTVNVVFNNTTVINLYTATATSPASIDAQMVNCAVTVNANENAYIANVHGGDGNTSSGTAYLDKLVFNLNDNARVYETFNVQNVRDLDIKISTIAEGRDETYTNAAQIVCTKSANYTALGTETADITYGSHGIKVGTKEPAFNAMYALTRNKVDECTWDEGKITTEATPDAPGVKTYTCSVCARTKTEEVIFVCETHAPVAKADGTYYCLNCNTVLEAPAADVILAAVPTTANSNVVTVDVKLTNTTGIWGTKFNVNAPAGFTLTGATSNLSSVSTDATAFTFTGATELALPYNMAVVNMATDAQGNLVDGTLDAVVVTLTFAVADTVENGTYVIEVACDETYNVAEEAVATTAVSAEVTVAVATVCTHENTTTTTVDATCTEAGSVTVVCD
ncbi:MAG: hypothetical protein IJA60_04195, partial [Clostridia bacterium]|nr:hypothetical protein [Clostridia bacterium]